MACPKFKRRMFFTRLARRLEHRVDSRRQSYAVLRDVGPRGLIQSVNGANGQSDKAFIGVRIATAISSIQLAGGMASISSVAHPASSAIIFFVIVLWIQRRVNCSTSSPDSSVGAAGYSAARGPVQLLAAATDVFPVRFA